MNIHAVTSQTLKVYNICPKACELRKECFCKDSKGLVATPQRGVKFRYCKDASMYEQEVKAFFCDETKNPIFSKSCPIQCRNPKCSKDLANGIDSMDTLSFYGGKLKTSCWLLSAGNDAYADFWCNQMEDDLLVEGYRLCPFACEGFY